MNERHSQIVRLTPAEVKALQGNGMYWCTSDIPCDADPVYRVSDVPQPGETTLNILDHLCEAHAIRYAQEAGLTLERDEDRGIGL
jgi:hypothetical protein